jgi:hypothetical protein
MYRITNKNIIKYEIWKNVKVNSFSNYDSCAGCEDGYDQPEPDPNDPDSPDGPSDPYPWPG